MILKLLDLTMGQLVALKALVLGDVLTVFAPLAVRRRFVFPDFLDVFALQPRAAGLDPAVLADIDPAPPPTVRQPGSCFGAAAR